MSERRDRQEIIGLADLYLPMTRCIGGHIVHSHLCCPWCESTEPCSGSDGVCFKEGIRGKHHRPSDYEDPKTRKQVGAFKIYGDKLLLR